MQIAVVRGGLNTIMSGFTAGTGSAFAVPPTFTKHKVVVTGTAGVSAGAIQVESSDDVTFAGTWNPVGAPIVVPNNGKVSYDFEGMYPFIRVRVSTNVVGGTVRVTYEAGY